MHVRAVRYNLRAAPRMPGQAPGAGMYAVPYLSGVHLLPGPPPRPRPCTPSPSSPNRHPSTPRSPGMAVFDTMRHIRPDVSTCCIGLAASMGAFILASGQQGKRYSLPNSRIMIHQPLGGAQGQATDIEIQANEILHHKLTLNGYIVRRTPRAGGQGGCGRHE